MDSIIKQLQKKAFSGNDILEVCDNQTKIITYPDLYNFKTIDDVVKPFNNVVILYETSPNYGHWICLIKHPNENIIEFFDPYGLFIDDQLKFISKKFRKENNEETPKLSLMLVKSKYKIIHNKYKLQKSSSDVSSCGRHVAMRIILKHIPLKKYIKMLTNSKYDPDMLVTYLTAFV